jgi:hypothetical protein
MNIMKTLSHLQLFSEQPEPASVLESLGLTPARAGSIVRQLTSLRLLAPHATLDRTEARGARGRVPATFTVTKTGEQFLELSTALYSLLVPSQPSPGGNSNE